MKLYHFPIFIYNKDNQKINLFQAPLTKKRGGVIKSILIDFIDTPYFLVDLYLFLYEFLAISLGCAVFSSEPEQSVVLPMAS